MDLDVTKAKQYLSSALNENVEISSITQLSLSTRTAPWLIEVNRDGNSRKFVFRMDNEITQDEVRVMEAVRSCSDLPVPRVYGWEEYAIFFDIPCFFYDYVDGDSLLQPLLTDETWARKCYLDVVSRLNTISEGDLKENGCTFAKPYTCKNVLLEDREFFDEHASLIADRAYKWLMDHLPEFPLPLFSNGDLWLDNILVKERHVVGVIDFEHAGFSDPIFEFLLPFFNEPRLRGRGIEAEYCRRLGINPRILDWYHGLEYLDTLRYVLRDGKPFNQYSLSVLEERLMGWLLEMERNQRGTF